MKITNEQLITMVNRPPIKFYKEDFRHGYHELNSCGNLLSAIVYDYEQEDNYTLQDRLHSYIKEALYFVLHKGYEPTFDNCHNWGYPMLCQSFALIKNKETLWNLFDEDEKERITVLMEMFVHMWNFGCNQYNGYKTGIGLHGNYQKNANPNYMFSNEALILYCIHFFGSMHDVCQVMIHNPYELVIEKLEKYGFTNALRVWTTEGFELPDGTKSAGAKELFGNRTTRRMTPQYWMEAYTKDADGNIYYAGRGKGCTLPYYYRERNFDVKDFESYPVEIYKHILGKCFDGGECVNTVVIKEEEDMVAHIKDNAISPYAGRDGMMFEFNSWDFMGTRSSLFHCEIDFYLAAAMFTTLKLLGNDILETYEDKEKVLVGMADFLFKKEHGYSGYCMGRAEDHEVQFVLDQWINHWTENYKI